MTTKIERSSVPDLGWCVDVQPDSSPYHRSWHWFTTRAQARDFARTTKRKWERWQTRLTREERKIARVAYPHLKAAEAVKQLRERIARHPG